MTNKYVQDYCDKFNLKIRHVKNGDCQILDRHCHVVGKFKPHDKYVLLRSSLYKKTDLASAILNDVKLHATRT